MQEAAKESDVKAVQWMDNDFDLFLGNLVKGIIFMFIVSGVFSLIFYLIQADRARKKEEPDYEEQGYVETKEFYKDTKKKKKKQSLAERLNYSPENRIRRAYYRRVKGEIGKRYAEAIHRVRWEKSWMIYRSWQKKYNEVRYKS